MIRVARRKSAAVARALAAPGRDGLSEIERAIWFHTGKPPARPLPPTLQKPAKLADFKAYKSDLVKQALEQMFGSRCAYCESRYVPVSPMDVEHYRPKNGYLGPDGKLVPPGYYWLAASWDNLLPSCIDCNRERAQARRKDGRIVKSKSGKANKFPVAPGSPRLEHPGSRKKEVPLLLDPCRDRPDLHLHFDLDGFVRPMESPEESQLPKGLSTIEVCGLDRDTLVAERRAVSLYVRGAIKNICAWERKMRDYPNDLAFAQQRDIAEQEFREQLAAAPRYLALTTALEEVFTEVRGGATAYHAALAAWTQSPANAARRASLNAAIARLKTLPTLQGPYASFAREILDCLVPDCPMG